MHFMQEKKLTHENSQTIYLGTDYLTMNSAPSGAELVQNLVDQHAWTMTITRLIIDEPPGLCSCLVK